jgi:hypothetical protein
MLNFGSGRRDLHAELRADEEWRAGFSNWLLNAAFEEGVQPAEVVDVSRSAASGPALQRIQRLAPGVAFNQLPEGEDFNKAAHRLRDSVWKDYQERSCFICMVDDREEWDLWVQCGHIYCKTCSEQLIRRRMKCPLCRTVCNSVLRAHPGPPPPLAAPEVSPPASRQQTPTTRTQYAGANRGLNEPLVETMREP